MAIRYSAHRTPKTPYEQSTAPQSSKISPHNISPQSPSSDQSPYNSTTIPVHSSDSTTYTVSKSPPIYTISPTPHSKSTSNAPPIYTVSKSPPIYTISPTPHSKSPPKSPHSTSNAPKRRSKYMHEPFGSYNNDELDAALGAYNNDEFKYDCIHCNIAAELPSNVNTTCLFCGENRPDCGQVASEDLGHQIEEAQLGDLARCGKMAITKDDTIILNGNYGMEHKDDINEANENIHSQIKATDTTYEKEKLEERLGKLSGGSNEVEVNDVWYWCCSLD
eukprot:13719_1